MIYADMRLTFSFLACGVLTAFAHGQNHFEIWSGCTNFASRVPIGNAAGEMLIQVPASHFAGIAQDATGGGTEFGQFRCTTQDRDAATQETYYLGIRADSSGAPDVVNPPLVRAGPFLTPVGTGVTAWTITTALATPGYSVLPLCSTFYVFGELTAATAADGQLFHVSTYLAGGTQGDNPAPNAPNLGWGIMNNAPLPAATPRTVRLGLLTPAPILNMGNVDPTAAASNCVSTLGGISYGVGGMWPQAAGAAGPRNDGLNARVRDAGNANGVAVVFLGASIGCPGLPLSGLASGALYLNPTGVFVQVGTAALDAAGLGVATIVPAGSLATQPLVNRIADFQAFTIGATFALPGKLSNRASVAFLP